MGCANSTQKRGRKHDVVSDHPYNREQTNQNSGEYTRTTVQEQYRKKNAPKRGQIRAQSDLLESTINQPINVDENSTNWKKKYEQLEKENATVEEREKALKQELENQKNSSEQVEQARKSEMHALKKENDALVDKLIESTKQDLEKTKNNGDQLEQKVNALEIEKVSLQGKLSEQRMENTAVIHSKNTQIKALEAEINKVKLQINDLNEQNSSLKKQIQGIEIKNPPLVPKRNKNAGPQVHRQVRAVSESPYSKQNELDTNPFKVLEQNTTLTEEINKVQDLNRILKTDVEALSQQKKLLQQDVQELQDRNFNLETDLEASKVQSQVQISELERKLEEFSRDKAAVPAQPEATVEENVLLSSEERYIAESMKKIQTITEDSKEYEKQIQDFQGTSSDRNYLHIEEMLIRNLVKLDDVESEGNADIRRERKVALQYVQKCLDDLKKKAGAE